MQRTAAQTRSHVLQVAGDLFYRNGIRATGIDRVAAEAGVAPTTLYRQFDSKDALVGAYVEHLFEDFEERFAAAVAAAGPDPRDQIRAIFEMIFTEVNADGYRGCGMLMTLAEFSDPELPAHRNAVDAKAWMRERFGELTERLDADDPAALADYLTVVFEGLQASAQSLGPAGPAKAGLRLVEVLLESTAAQSRSTAAGR